MMLFDRDGRVFVARRIDTAQDAWQMPQGGIDSGETPAEAALRELEEEIGTAKAEIIAESGAWLTYDLPEALAKTLWYGRYRGQRQKWFALKFKGSDSDIRLDRHTPEFDAWRWAKLEEAPGAIVPFKRPVYEAVAERFRKWAAGAGASPADFSEEE